MPFPTEPAVETLEQVVELEQAVVEEVGVSGYSVAEAGQD
jgi:hypothetical protein